AARGDVVAGVRAEHGHPSIVEERQQVGQRARAAGLIRIDRAGLLATAELAGTEQQDIALADTDAAARLGELDVGDADPVAAHHRSVDQYAAGDDAATRRLDAVAGCALPGGHAAGRDAVVHVTVPEEVGQAVDVGDGVAVENHAEVVARRLAVGTFARAVAL